MNASVLADLSAPLRALRLLAAEFGHLPAPCVSVSTVYPDRLELAFHGGFASFEVWREALGIAPEAVVHRVHGNGETAVLEVHGDFAGARLRLIAYTSVAVGTLIAAGAGVGP